MTGDGYMDYTERYIKYSFKEGRVSYDYKQQHEAVIMKTYHSIEKGLAKNKDYRPGFGEKNIRYLIALLKSWADKYDTGNFAYRAALSCIYEYLEKNKRYGHIDSELEQIINGIPGKSNGCGGSELFNVKRDDEIENFNYKEMVQFRRSIRQFSKEAVKKEKILKALELAQSAPSACNRQGWKVRIVQGLVKDKVLENQNGNKGFGETIDKLLIITMDLRYSNSQREKYQAYIDGGIYAQSLLNALTYYNIATVPLSAALTEQQDANVREIANIDEAEILILFIGAGNYPDEDIYIPKSTRRPAKAEII